MTNTNDYNNFFQTYKNSTWQIENHLRFWHHFMTTSIDNYKADNPGNSTIYESGFSIYNIPSDVSKTWLNSSNHIFSINPNNLKEQSDNFFNWIMNLSIVRIYNSAELLLLQSIQHKFFPACSDPSTSKQEMDMVVGEIKRDLGSNGFKVKKRNNEYLVTFLQHKVVGFNDFLNKKINEDWNTTWMNYFTLFSILRSIVVHHGMMISTNAKNQLFSSGGDAFKYYFDIANSKSTEILKAKDLHSFLSFAGQMNDFVGNTVRLLAEQTTLNFIGLSAV